MSAPAFTSFPSFASFPQAESGPSKPREDNERGHSTKISRRHKQSRSKPSKHHDTAQDDHVFSTREPRENPSVFYVDSKGNRNAHYGASDPVVISKYQPVTHHQILGLQADWIATRRTSRGIEIDTTHVRRRKMPGLTDSKATRLLLQVARPLSKIKRRDKDESDDFIRVARRPEKQNILTDSINHEAFKSDSEESSSAPASDLEPSDNEDDMMALSSHQAVLKSLEEKLRDDPSSVDTWFALLSQSTSIISLDSKNAVKTRAEIALSILSRAISACPSNKTSVRMRLKYLKAGEEVWDDRKRITEWEAAFELESVDIWAAWLDWRISKAKDGTDGIVEDVKRILTALGPHNEVGSLRIQWRAAITLRQAGYVERAMAIFQCQAELAFDIPQPLYGLPLATQIESLEDFWESECPRLGETDSHGWAAWEKAGRPEYLSVPKTLNHRSQSSTVSDQYQRWAAEEAVADSSFDIPARSTDDADDPYSTILFSDIKPLLISLQSIEAKRIFRLIWISFLGLHIPGFSTSLSELAFENLDDRWCHTHLITSSYLRSIFPPQAMANKRIADSHSGVLVGNEKQYSNSFGPVKNWGYGACNPHDWQADHNQALWTKTDIACVHEEFVRHVFRRCRMGNEDIEWDSLAIAFETAVGSKAGSKLSRSLLSSDQNSLLRWNIHASLERARGRIEEARKIYGTVLLSSTLPSSSSASLLWWGWAELEWLMGQSEAAQNVILRAVGVDGTSGTSILRAKRALEVHMEAPSTTWKEQEAWIKIRALLEILTSFPPVPAAMFFLDESIARYQPGTVQHESLTVASMTLIYYLGTTLRNPTPPAILRERAAKALQIYPSNSIVWGMFLESQRGQGIWGKVREQLGAASVDGRLKEKDVMRWVIEVWIESGWEHGRWHSEQERVRAGLSNAIQHERTSGSLILWRIYIEFEILAGQLDRAKELLFRAVCACPLVKDLYLLAFGPLRTVFTGRELDVLAETMAERGLRIRRGLEEVLVRGEGGEVNGKDGGGEDIGEADIEHNADELRRLRPY